MNVYITRGNRTGKPFLLSIEDKSVLLEGQTEFTSTQTSSLVTGFDCTCTQTVFNTLKDKVGTLQAPALIDSVLSQPFDGRMNCYIENGSLKILAQ